MTQALEEIPNFVFQKFEATDSPPMYVALNGVSISSEPEQGIPGVIVATTQDFETHWILPAEQVTSESLQRLFESELAADYLTKAPEFLAGKMDEFLARGFKWKPNDLYVEPTQAENHHRVFEIDKSIKFSEQMKFNAKILDYSDSHFLVLPEGRDIPIVMHWLTVVEDINADINDYIGKDREVSIPEGSLLHIGYNSIKSDYGNHFAFRLITIYGPAGFKP